MLFHPLYADSLTQYITLSLSNIYTLWRVDKATRAYIVEKQLLYTFYRAASLEEKLICCIDFEWAEEFDQFLLSIPEDVQDLTHYDRSISATPLGFTTPEERDKAFRMLYQVSLHAISSGEIEYLKELIHRMDDLYDWEYSAEGGYLIDLMEVAVKCNRKSAADQLFVETGDTRYVGDVIRRGLFAAIDMKNKQAARYFLMHPRTESHASSFVLDALLRLNDNAMFDEFIYKASILRNSYQIHYPDTIKDSISIAAKNKNLYLTSRILLLAETKYANSEVREEVHIYTQYIHARLQQIQEEQPKKFLCFSCADPFLQYITLADIYTFWRVDRATREYIKETQLLHKLYHTASFEEKLICCIQFEWKDEFDKLLSRIPIFGIYGIEHNTHLITFLERIGLSEKIDDELTAYNTTTQMLCRVATQTMILGEVEYLERLFHAIEGQLPKGNLSTSVEMKLFEFMDMVVRLGRTSVAHFLCQRAQTTSRDRRYILVGLSAAVDIKNKQAARYFLMQPSLKQCGLDAKPFNLLLKLNDNTIFDEFCSIIFIPRGWYTSLGEICASMDIAVNNRNPYLISRILQMCYGPFVSQSIREKVLAHTQAIQMKFQHMQVPFV